MYCILGVITFQKREITLFTQVGTLCIQESISSFPPTFGSPQFAQQVENIQMQPVLYANHARKVLTWLPFG